MTHLSEWENQIVPIKFSIIKVVSSLDANILPHTNLRRFTWKSAHRILSRNRKRINTADGRRPDSYFKCYVIPRNFHIFHKSEYPTEIKIL